MPKEGYKKIPLDERMKAALAMITRFKTGKTVDQISEELNISPSQLYRLEKKLEKTGDISDLERSGRPSKVTKTMEDRIVMEIKRHPFKTSVEIANDVNTGLPEEEKISDRTVRYYALKHAYLAYRPALKPKLTPEQKA